MIWAGLNGDLFNNGERDSLAASSLYTKAASLSLDMDDPSGPEADRLGAGNGVGESKGKQARRTIAIAKAGCASIAFPQIKSLMTSTASPAVAEADDERCTSATHGTRHEISFKVGARLPGQTHYPHLPTCHRARAVQRLDGLKQHPNLSTNYPPRWRGSKAVTDLLALCLCLGKPTKSQCHELLAPPLPVRSTNATPGRLAGLLDLRHGPSRRPAITIPGFCIGPALGGRGFFSS